MHNDEDINLNLNPGDGGDGSPGGYYFFPAGPVDLTAADVAAQIVEVCLPEKID
ncbi:MAG: hypothetical protein IKH25_07745 [Muribaculaceae bacterium]|nr:hypothetical protein [Muribaculaceae bacterium]